jgi:hypothetical protein
VVRRHDGLEAGLVELHGLSHRPMRHRGGGNVKWPHEPAVFSGKASRMSKIEAAPPDRHVA